METTWNSMFSVHKLGFIITQPRPLALVSSVAVTTDITGPAELKTVILRSFMEYVCRPLF